MKVKQPKKRINMICSYMDLYEPSVRELEFVNSWLYKHYVDDILNAIDLCNERLRRIDVKYIDGLLMRLERTGSFYR